MSLADFSLTQIDSLLEQAAAYSLQPKEFHNHQKNKVVALAFFEASTRTKLSFDVALKKLGCSTLDFFPETSSLSKGESVADTLRTISALGADAIIMRHHDDDLCFDLSKKLSIPIINAGSGKRDHPSQNLLDLLTIKEEFQTLKGLKIGIIGDIKHSRVAHGFMNVANRYGMELMYSGPKELVPDHLPNYEINDLVRSADVIMCLRYQLERMKNKVDVASFHHDYGLTEKRAQLMQKSAIIMHPAPINRGIEIASSLVESSHSRIFRQMELGVFARMSILDFILGGN